MIEVLTKGFFTKGKVTVTASNKSYSIFMGPVSIPLPFSIGKQHTHTKRTNAGKTHTFTFKPFIFLIFCPGKMHRSLTVKL
ncbi:hypothetical protein GDO86_012440 [Hymenochirus boettgeri]|uniref:Uncharacterized protein n=1 Tax=Hymenochirus boettgeri TaxID=247094 RepID=A0A8T2IV66_9PIPI|nr:hypothetical protein GDO86_012440 [Hymenochirus boettgeri]